MYIAIYTVYYDICMSAQNISGKLSLLMALVNPG